MVACWPVTRVLTLPARRVPERISWGSGSARIAARGGLDLLDQLGHLVGGDVDALDRGPRALEHGRDLLDDARLHRLVDQLLHRGEQGAQVGRGLLDPTLADQRPEVRHQQAEVLRGGADPLVGDEAVEVGEEVDGGLDHLLERQAADPLERALRRGGDAGDVGGGARQQRVGLGVAVELGRWRVRDLGEIDVERLRKQARGRKPGAEAAMLDPVSEEVERGGDHLVVGTGLDAEPAGDDRERGAQGDVLALGRVEQGRRLQRPHLADGDAAELDRGAGPQTADRAVEDDVERQPLAGFVLEQVLPGGGLRRVELEDVAGRDPGGVGADVVEGNAALQQRDEARDVERGAAGAELDRKAARVPETGGLGQPLVVRRVDEGVDHHVAGLGQRDVLDLADLDLLEEDRGADRHRAAVGGAEPDAQPRRVGGGQRRALQPLEAVLRLADLAVPEGLDVDAGNHRLDAGDPLGGDAGAHHPELGVGVGEVRHVLVEAGGDHDLLQVGGEVDRLDDADDDVAEAQRGGSGLDAGGVLEGDLDQRAAARVGAPSDAERHDQREERHEPDRREPARGRLGLGALELRGGRRGFRHGRRTLARRCPRSGAGRETAPKAL